MQDKPTISKLNDPEAYLKTRNNKLLVIDEVQRKPELFRLLRSVIDERIRAGERTSQFLILGSASPRFLRQSSESLAGRIRHLELNPFSVNEVYDSNIDNFEVQKLWLRGGFPNSYLADNDNGSWNWRQDFILTFVERELPKLGVRIPSTTMHNFWSKLAWENAQPINYSRLGLSLGVSYHTIQKYLEILKATFVVRELRPWSGNLKKRLIKSPKIYLRDSGLNHRLLRITSYQDLLGHPMVGASWEAFVIENILRELPDYWDYSYYRTRAQAEVDLVLEGPRRQVLAVDIKHSTAPGVTRGFHVGCKDIKATGKFVIYPGSERFSMKNDIESIGILEFLHLIN